MLLTKGTSTRDRKDHAAARVVGGFASLCALAALSAVAAPSPRASLSRSVDVQGSPSAVWEKIGRFCAIKDWHPAIGACTEDGKTPPTRTLVTKDGAATFIELQTARSDTGHFYSYTFTSAPVPVTNYSSTFKVAAKEGGMSTITWSSVYAPNTGHEADAMTALTGIYESGLESIKTRLSGAH
ncbi:MAG: SRPBCC family protein [Hyphomonadaceae bacterium]|nr:SRPBCC family protein [Hyphomonadaceae bacterium]